MSNTTKEERQIVYIVDDDTLRTGVITRAQALFPIEDSDEAVLVALGPSDADIHAVRRANCFTTEFQARTVAQLRRFTALASLAPPFFTVTRPVSEADDLPVESEALAS
jgi:hypothetical protein